MQNFTDKFINKLELHGIKAKVISIEHMEEIQSDIEKMRSDYNDVKENLGVYFDKFKFNGQKEGFEAKSIIVVAVPQPIVKIHFTADNKKFTAVIPPTYLLNTSADESKQPKIAEVTSVLNNILSENNYKAAKVNLPCKLLAVRSGLGEYGKNNVCYINAGSSFYWIGSYISDMPCETDSFREKTVMDKCYDCNLCLTGCPSGAIGSDRFIVHAGRCITLYNESTDEFPEWIDPSWHNSIIGCMRCQLICPANRDSLNNIEELADFNVIETDLILKGTPIEDLPETTYSKLQKINFVEDYALLARNAGMLVNKQ